MVDINRDTVAVLATGPSLNIEDVEYVRGRCRCVAVSNAYSLAPWADVLVSTDQAWWDYHKPEFFGRKMSVTNTRYPGVERIDTFSGMNSGALGIMAADILGCKRILLLGFDLHSNNGAHYFGEHPDELKKTPDHRFEVFINQINNLKMGLDYRGIDLINCTPGSALTTTTYQPLREIL